MAHQSAILGTGRLRFLEVKGRVAGAKTVTVTKNEILTALNKPDDFILAIVEVDGAALGPGQAGSAAHCQDAGFLEELAGSGAEQRPL